MTLARGCEIKHRLMKHPLLLCMLCLAFVFSSCDKEEDTIALISVVDVEGEPVEQVLVRLFPEPSSSSAQEGNLIPDVEQFTDARGQATFDFSEYYEQGQAGFAVLNIEATKDTVFIEGIIKIDPEVVNEETLIFQ